MASGDVSSQSPNFPGLFMKDNGGYNVVPLEGRMLAVPVQQPEIHQRQWFTDERDAFISWLRGEFAAANAIIDAMCHHLRMIGEPGEYDYVFTGVQQRRHNWTILLHMQQYFSVAEVVNALQQVAWRKQQACRPDPTRMQQTPSKTAQDVSSGMHKRLSMGSHKDVKQDFSCTSSLFPPAQIAVVEDASTNRDCSQPEKELKPNSTGTGCATRGEESVSSSCSADAHSFNQQQTPGSNVVTKDTAFDFNKDLTGSSSAGDGKELKQDVLVDYENGRSSSPSNGQGSIAGKLSNMDFHLTSKEEGKRLAMIKTSKQFYCSEYVEGKMINVVEGLELHENVFNKVEISQLVHLINELQAAGRRGELGGQIFSTYKRQMRVKEAIQFGDIFPDRLEDGKVADGSQPIPAFCQVIFYWLIQWGILPANIRPGCCSINIFDEGDFEPPHMKQHDLERPFCILSLMGDCTMVFGHCLSMDHSGECKGPFRITLPIGSVLVLRGNVADIAKQAIPASPSKRIVITFGTRLSTTVSTLTPASVATPHNAMQTIMKTTAWPASVGWQGSSIASNSVGTGMVLKHYNMAPASGVMPVASINTSPQMPQPIHQHIPMPSVQPLFTSPTGPVGSYSPVAIMAQGWSAAPRAARLPSIGTGVFFPSSGPGRPIAVPPWQSGLIVLSPVSQKTDSLVAPSALEAHTSARSNRAARQTGQISADQSNQVIEKGTSVSIDLLASRKKPGKEPVSASPKHEVNGSGNITEEDQSRDADHSKGATGNRVHSGASVR